MSLHPLFDSDSVNDKSLHLYTNTLNADTLNADTINCNYINASNIISRNLFEPVFLATLLHYTDLKSCQTGTNLPFGWVVQEDTLTATIYGQFQMTGNNKDEVIIFTLPTSYDLNNNNNICITSMGRSRNISDVSGNPTGANFSVYFCDIILSSGTPAMRLFWRSESNVDDPVNDPKFFYFTATYKK